MIVAVKQDEVTEVEQCCGNDFIGGAGAVKNEVCLVGSEHFRGVTLRLNRRSLVDEQIAEVYVSVAQVVAEDALAKVLEEELSTRRFSVELAALMSWAVEC